MDNIDSLARLGLQDKKLKQLLKKGISSGTELLTFFPRKYYDYSKPTNTIAFGERCCLIMQVNSVQLRNVKNPTVLTAYGMTKDNVPVKITWFRCDYLYHSVYACRGKDVVVGGKIEYDDYNQGYAFVAPEVFTSDMQEGLQVLPVYSKIPDMSQAYLRGCISQAMDIYAGQITSCIPRTLEMEWNLIPKEEAIRMTHFPQTMQEVEQAQTRLLYEDLYYFSLRMKSEEGRFQEKSPYKASKSALYGWKLSMIGDVCLKFVMFSAPR